MQKIENQNTKLNSGINKSEIKNTGHEKLKCEIQGTQN